MAYQFVRRFPLYKNLPLEARQKMADELVRAIEVIGSAAELSRMLGIKPSAICPWERCPAEHAAEVEYRTNGVVTRYQLRPDIFGEDPVSKRR